MHDRGEHCPFLNRADERCSTHFRLDRLDEAFEHCFDAYPVCPVYQQLLLERRSAREAARLADARKPGWHPTDHSNQPLVNLTVHSRSA